MNKEGIENLLWSALLPGLGQVLNKRYIKGIFILGLGLLVNVKSYYNIAVLMSFHGNFLAAIEQTNYFWLMFYPCLYAFAMWDTYKDAKEVIEPFSYLPLVSGAYFATVGLIFSSSMKLFWGLTAPVLSPIIFGVLGVSVGFMIKKILFRINKLEND
ncbi:DUF5683 domain-containing protein [Oceanobacillus picturae]|uniref:hypothetical protein n=1 Tax=Oceanobacillus picturae TaxID=171693 RepID=UPI0036396515